MKRTLTLRLAMLVTLVATAACGQSASLTDKPPYLAASSDVIDFGTLTVGDEQERTLFFINKGDKVMTMGDPSGDTLGGVFSVVLEAATVNPSSEVKARITFAPADATDYNVAISFPNDSDNEPSFVVSLKGKGIAPDPCDGVTCNTPPSPACLGSGTSRFYDPEGDCSDGECSYTMDTESCAYGCDAASGLCNGNPCIGMVCNTPPAPTCLGVGTSQVYNSVGQCGNGVCSYSVVPETCPFGCDSATGLCKADPCIGVVCNSAPSACYQTVGSCNGGNCVYPPANGGACDDSNLCTVADTCLEGGCRGTPKLCAEPPASVCVDANVRRSWATQGTCQTNNGQCSYTQSELNCAFGCNATTGNCNGDPCQGVVCSTPPNGCYQNSGTCNNGTCSYGFNNGASCNDDKLCTLSDTCSQGACVGTPKACVTPPANTCLDANHVRQYTTSGECSTGTGNCTYTYTDVTCQYGCINNACANEPNYGSDALDLRLTFDRSNSLWDMRDIDLVYANPVGSKCDFTNQYPNWGVYNEVRWTAAPDAYKQETIMHTPPRGAQADGTYRISGAAISLCNKYYGVYCDGETNTGSSVEIRVNNVLKMTCAYTFLEDNGPAVIDYATITRTNGYYANPVASGASGVTCTTP